MSTGKREFYKKSAQLVKEVLLCNGVQPPWLSLWESCHRKVTERALRLFLINLLALSVLAALGHLSHRERQGRLTMIQEQAQHIILLCLLTV